VKTIKCQNYRHKTLRSTGPDGAVVNTPIQRAECGRIISHVRDVEDKAYIVYCAGCKCFVEITIKNKHFSQKPLAKDEVSFNDIVECEMLGYQVIGV